MSKLQRNPKTGWFDFETAEMQGAIQAGGNQHGIRRLVHKPTGVQVVNLQLYLLNLYRLLSVNYEMGEARTMEHTAELKDGGIEVRWAPNREHQVELTARYEVNEPNVIDLTVTVRSHGVYAGYELFVSSYFDFALRPHVYLKRTRHLRETGKAELVAPSEHDLIRGCYLVFPRDLHAARKFLDGRWERGPNPVHWCVGRYYAYPMGFYADAKRSVAVVLMSRPKDCFAVCSTYEGEETDSVARHNSMYLSLFGDDLLPGDERIAKVRLAITALDEAMSQPLALYQAFASQSGLC